MNDRNRTDDFWVGVFFFACLLVICIGFCRGCDDEGGGHGQRIAYVTRSS